jgi:hypothetical protein
MITDATLASSRLRDLLRDVLRDEHDRPKAIDPRALARRIQIESGDRACDGATRAAERELLRVHRSEIAYLLRRAADLRRGAGESGALSLDAWRACMREQLDCIALDRLHASGELLGLLESCARGAIAGWPSASELARASLALHDVEAGRVAVAEALLDAGAVHEAASSFASALQRSVDADNFGRLLEGLIEAQHRLGHGVRARGLADCARGGAS